jgi:hypothetical protein
VPPLVYSSTAHPPQNVGGPPFRRPSSPSENHRSIVSYATPHVVSIDHRRSLKGTKRLCATDENVVDGNVDELDNVADGAHNKETDTNGLADLDL